MKILITGGAGFIGSHLTDALIKKSHKVVIIDNLSTGLKQNINPKAKFYKASIQNKNIANILKKEKPKTVFHLAAQINLRTSIINPVFDAHVNILGSLNILDCCIKHNVKKFIFASSAAVYGKTKTLPSLEKHPTQPDSPYGLGKLTIEKYLKIFENIHNIKCTALRYANVYGPRQNILGEAGVIAIFVNKILNNKQCIINGKGTQTRDYVYVNDIVKANILALNNKKTGVYNVSTNIQTSVNKLFKIISKITNKPCNKKHGNKIKGEVQKSCLDYKKAKKDLKYSPKTNLNKGLKLTIDSFKKI